MTLTFSQETHYSIFRYGRQKKLILQYFEFLSHLPLCYDVSTMQYLLQPCVYCTGLNIFCSIVCLINPQVEKYYLRPEMPSTLIVRNNYDPNHMFKRERICIVALQQMWRLAENLALLPISKVWAHGSKRNDRIFVMQPCFYCTGLNIFCSIVCLINSLKENCSGAQKARCLTTLKILSTFK